MTIGELRKALADLPEDMPVMLQVSQGDETGFLRSMVEQYEEPAWGQPEVLTLVLKGDHEL